MAEIRFLVEDLVVFSRTIVGVGLRPTPTLKPSYAVISCASYYPRRLTNNLRLSELTVFNLKFSILNFQFPNKVRTYGLR